MKELYVLDNDFYRWKKEEGWRVFDPPKLMTRDEATDKFRWNLICVNTLSSGPQGEVEVLGVFFGYDEIENSDLGYTDILFGRFLSDEMKRNEPDDSYYLGLSQKGTGTKLYGEYYGLVLSYYDVGCRFLGYSVCAEPVERKPEMGKRFIIHLVGTPAECYSYWSDNPKVKMITSLYFSSRRHPVIFQHRGNKKYEV